jgi:hypothetical protein
MRKIARWILSFDACPSSYRKNYKEEFLSILGMILVSGFFVAMFFAMFLIS